MPGFDTAQPDENLAEEVRRLAGIRVYKAEMFNIDCTGATDTAAAFQAAIDDVPDNSTLEFPRGAEVNIETQLDMSSRSGITFRSDVVSASAAGLGIPELIWTGANNGTMFNVDHCRMPTFQNLKFTLGTSKIIDKYINFDGEPAGSIGTRGVVRGCHFTSRTQKNANFIAVAISETAQNNHENYAIEDCTFASEDGFVINVRARDGVAVASDATFTSAAAVFVAGDVGKRIRISYAGGIHDTTIASRTSATEVELTAAPSFSQTNCTIHIGQVYGIGLLLGASANSKHHIVHNNTFTGLEYGIKMMSGSADIAHIGGGQNEVSVYVATCTESTEIAYYESESDMRGIWIANPTGVLVLSQVRLDNSNQRADGFISLGGGVQLQFTNTPFTAALSNARIIVKDPVHSLSLDSFLNKYNTTRAIIGYDQFTDPTPNSIGDGFTDGPSSQFRSGTNRRGVNLGQWAHVNSYTVAGVPSASTAGAGSWIYVTNEGGGAVHAYSDGTNWRRVTDGAVISASSTTATSAAAFRVTSDNVNAQTGTTYTLVAADNGKTITSSNAGAVTFTVPASLGAGFSCTVIQIGAGQVTFSASGTTINPSGTLKIAAQHGAASLYAYAADTFNLCGNIAA